MTTFGTIGEYVEVAEDCTEYGERKSGQSVANFVAELRQLSEHCEFGAVLDDMLRDRLLCGINEDEIQHRLLSETAPTLTFKKALEISQGMETAASNAKDIQKGHAGAQPVAVHHVKKDSSSDWLRKIKLNWHEVKYTGTTEDVLQRYSEVYRDELGTLKGMTVKLHIDPNATPRFYKPRVVSYAMKQKVEEELERLQAVGIIEPGSSPSGQLPLFLL
ncbi:hypothetical protein SRHO_G00238270 [Serrasalmus rhombeus]